MTNDDPREAGRLTENPLWDVVKLIPGDPIALEFDGRWSPTGHGMVMRDGEFGFDKTLPRRSDLVREYSWAIPDPGTLAWLVERIDGRAVVESGAGTGYWAWQLNQLGVEIAAYDQAPPDVDRNFYHSPREKVWHVYTQEDQDRLDKQWAPLREAHEYWMALPEDQRDETMTFPEPQQLRIGEGEWIEAPTDTRRSVFHPITKAAVRAVPAFPDRVLFLCWPPYDSPMALNALGNYTGDTLIYLGEGEGGCNGDDAFFEALDWRWMPMDSHTPVQWEGIHDRVTVYRRLPS